MPTSRKQVTNRFYIAVFLIKKSALCLPLCKCMCSHAFITTLFSFFYFRVFVKQRSWLFPWQCQASNLNSHCIPMCSSITSACHCWWNKSRNTSDIISVQFCKFITNQETSPAVWNNKCYTSRIHMGWKKPSCGMGLFNKCKHSFRKQRHSVCNMSTQTRIK